jgi:hypothetical protein
MAKKGQGGGNLNNEEKRAYLREQGINITSDNSTYVQRIYSAIKQQVAGNLKPSLTLARRGSTAFKYIPARTLKKGKAKGKKVLPRYGFARLNVEDVAAFVKASKQDRFTFIVTGLANADSPKRKVKRDITKPITLGIGPVPREMVEDAIKDSSTMLELMNYISPNAPGFEGGLEWEEITSVSILRNN